MRRLSALFLITLFFGMVSAGDVSVLAVYSQSGLAQESLGGPTIDWYESPEVMVLAWDGIYDGQTEHNWPFALWVNDSEGVDTVIFRVRWYSETEWMNISAVLTTGNETRGFYQGNFTYAIWWDWDTGRVGTEGDGGHFFYKVWANDTLGNWSEVEPIQYSGGYMVVYPPAAYLLFRTPIGWAIIGAGFIVTIVMLTLYRRRRKR